MLGFNGGRIGLKNTIESSAVVGPSTDPYYDNVGFILNGGDFIDGSKYAATVTATSIDLDPTIRNFGEYSYEINGNSDVLGVGDQGQFDLGTNDFTIEGWVYLTASNNSLRSIFQKRGGSGGTINYIYYTLSSSNIPKIYISSDGSSWDIANGVVDTLAPTLNAWTHCAICRQGSDIRFFMGGVLTTTITTSLPISNDPTALFEFGSDVASGNFDGARLGGVRVTNGVARYTANFTPPTSIFNVGALGFKASGMWTLAEQERLRYQAVWPGNNVPVPDGLVVYLDTAQSTSYPGTGTTWTNIAPAATTADLTLTGSYTYSSDFGGVIDFNGVDAYAESNSTLPEAGGLFADASNSWSVTAFFYVDGLITQRNGIVSRSTSTTSSGTFALNHNNSSIEPNIRGLATTTGPDIVTNDWYEATIVWDGLTAELYFNGAYYMPLRVGTSNEQVAATFEVGTLGAYTTPCMDGKVPVVLVYNRALTASEVSRNFNTFRNRYGI